MILNKNYKLHTKITCSTDEFKSFITYDLRQVTVDFFENQPIEEVVRTINSLPNPNIIVWYVGCRGLRQAGVQYYRDFLIAPVLEQNAQARFWLTDLSAWASFKNARNSLKKQHSCCDAIDKYLPRRIRCIRSAHLFERMQQMSDTATIEYFRKALSKCFIHANSLKFPDSHIKAGDVFQNNCRIMSDWYDLDTSKAYSVFQYFEGCLLIDEIITQLLHEEESANGNRIQIVFALPNDEIKYYKDSQKSFQRDVAFLLSKNGTLSRTTKWNLDIKFLSFKYGTKIEHRPYNAPGKTLKTEHLSSDKIITPSKTRAEKVEYAANQ